MEGNFQGLFASAQAINQLVSATLPDGVTVSEAAVDSVTRAATFLILCATSNAGSLVIGDSRNIVSSEDVIQAMSLMQLDEFKDAMIKFLANIPVNKLKMKTSASAPGAMRRLGKKASEDPKKE